MPELVELYKSQRRFFDEAYSYGESRVEKGFGWPTEVTTDVRGFLRRVKRLRMSTVLDLGCGEGRNAEYFAQNGFEIYAVDYSKLAVDRAAQRISHLASRIHFILGEAFHLPFRAGSFELLLDWGCFHHVRKQDWRTYLREMVRVLKTGGYFSVTVFSLNDAHLSNKKRNWIIHRGHYDHYFKKDELRSVFKDQFQIIGIREFLLKEPAPAHRYYHLEMRKR